MGGVFRIIGRQQREIPIEPLDRESLFTRIGGPAERIVPVAQPCDPKDEGCPRIDGPRPRQPRSWRQVVERSR